MKIALIVGGVILSLMLFIGCVMGISYITYSNYGNEQENLINTGYENNKNILSQYSLKVLEASKISDKYSDSVKKLIETALSARYGKDGSNAAMQWITEQNPNLDQAVFIKIQNLIEAGRNEYQVSQTSLLDKCNIYKTNLGYLWDGFWLRVSGYPKEGLAKKCTAIKSEYSNDAYETGIEKGVL